MLPVFVINLDRSPHRLETIAATLDRLGVPFERVAAVDGSDPARLAGLPVEPSFGRAPLRAGEIGCFASHVAVWRAVVDRGLAAAIVLEDDIVPDAGFAEIAEALATVDFDFVRLAKIRPKGGLFYGEIAGRRVIEAVGFSKVGGAGAYALSADAARRLLAAATGWSVPVDDFIDQIWLHGVRSFEFEPALADHGPMASDIYATSPKAERAELRRGPLERATRELRRFASWLAWAGYTATRVLPDHARRRLAARAGRPMRFGRPRGG